MRKLFADWLFEQMAVNPNIILITADTGYGLLDKIRDTYPAQFYNVGAAEQLMVGMAAGMAMEGKIPICYTITSFLLWRPFEFIKNYANHEQLPIKFVGCNRDKDYGHLGYTHYACDDIDIMSSLENIIKVKPDSNWNDLSLKMVFGMCIYLEKPCYLNLTR
jgi:transketolase